MLTFSIITIFISVSSDYSLTSCKSEAFCMVTLMYVIDILGYLLTYLQYYCDWILHHVVILETDWWNHSLCPGQDSRRSCKCPIVFYWMSSCRADAAIGMWDCTQLLECLRCWDPGPDSGVWAGLQCSCPRIWFQVSSSIFYTILHTGFIVSLRKQKPQKYLIMKKFNQGWYQTLKKQQPIAFYCCNNWVLPRPQSAINNLKGWGSVLQSVYGCSRILRVFLITCCSTINAPTLQGNRYSRVTSPHKLYLKPE